MKQNIINPPPLQKRAFTLAEILVALVIIGVVAALTISPLINSYVESSTVSKVKKGLSILGQAKKLAENQNGSIEGWEYELGNNSTTVAQFWNYLKPYITVAKDCGTSTDCYKVDEIFLLNGNPHENNYNAERYYKIALADGSVMWIRMPSAGKCSSRIDGLDNNCASFWIDVNGEKAPNAIGKDIFLFLMNPDGVYPTVLNDCYKNMDGAGCSSYIIKNGNMKYLH